MKMKYFPAFLFFMVVAILSSCDSQQSISESTSPNSIVSKSTKVENQIVFLFFTIEKSQNGTDEVKLTNKKITEGFVKNASITDKEYAVGSILVTFLGKDGEVISKRIIEDPLNPEMEIYAEEGLNREKISLPKAEFSIRFNQTGSIAEVQLEKIHAQSKTNLITIKL